MQYTYVVSGEKVNISTPGVANLSDIKNDVQEFSDHIIRHSIYPNGFEITMVQFSDHVVTVTNYPLESTADGGFIAPTNK